MRLLSINGLLQDFFSVGKLKHMVYDWCLWSVLLTTLVSTIWKKLRSSAVQLQWSKTTHPQTYWSVDRYLLDYGCPTSKYNHNKHHSISNHDFGLYPYYSSLVKPWSLITLLFLLTSDPTVNHQRLACPSFYSCISLLNLQVPAAPCLADTVWCSKPQAGWRIEWQYLGCNRHILAKNLEARPKHLQSLLEDILKKTTHFFGVSKLQIEMGSENKVPQNPMVSNLFPGTLFSIFRYLIIQWL